MRFWGFLERTCSFENGLLGLLLGSLLRRSGSGLGGRSGLLGGAFTCWSGSFRGWFSSTTTEFCNENDHDVSVCIGFDALWELEIADVEGFAEACVGNVQCDFFWKIEWQASDVQRVGEEFQQTTCTNPGGVADEFDWHVSVDDFVFTHSVEVDVDDAAAESVVLHVLNESEFGFLGVFDFEIDQDLFADAVGKHVHHRFAIEAKIDAVLLLAVNDSRDQAFLAEAFEGTRSATFASVGFEDLDFGHVLLFGFFKGEPLCTPRQCDWRARCMIDFPPGKWSGAEGRLL